MFAFGSHNCRQRHLFEVVHILASLIGSLGACTTLTNDEIIAGQKWFYGGGGLRKSLSHKKILLKALNIACRLGAASLGQVGIAQKICLNLYTSDW